MAKTLLHDQSLYHSCVSISFLFSFFFPLSFPQSDNFSFSHAGGLRVRIERSGVNCNVYTRSQVNSFEDAKELKR